MSNKGNGKVPNCQIADLSVEVLGTRRLSHAEVGLGGKCGGASEGVAAGHRLKVDEELTELPVEDHSDVMPLAVAKVYAAMRRRAQVVAPPIVSDATVALHAQRVDGISGAIGAPPNNPTVLIARGDGSDPRGDCVRAGAEWQISCHPLPVVETALTI